MSTALRPSTKRGDGRRPGDRTGTKNFTPAELEVVDHFARALSIEKYRSTFEAAPDCAAALRKLRRLEPSLPERNVAAARRAIQKRAERLGLSWKGSHWSAEEQDIVLDHARGVVLGKYPNQSVAIRACQEAIAKKVGRRHLFDATAWHLRRALRDLGVPAEDQDWTREETRTLRKYAKMAYSGPPCTVRGMAKACSKALGGRRSPSACRTQMKKLVAEFSQPRYHGFSLEWEQELYERYAVAVVEGKYPNKMAAARACLAEFRKRQQQERRKAKGRFVPAYKRKLEGVYSCIERAWVRLGFPVIERRFWEGEEAKLRETWRKWFEKRRHIPRYNARTLAAEGLQQELAQKGFERTYSACYNAVGIPEPF